MTAPQIHLLKGNQIAIRTGDDSWRVIQPESRDTEIYGELPADAQRFILEDPIETNIEAAFGEIEELRRQRDYLEQRLLDDDRYMVGRRSARADQQIELSTAAENLARCRERLSEVEAERDELRAAVGRVRKLCDYYAGDTLWPLHVVAALDDAEEPT